MEQHRLLEQAALWRLLGLLLERPRDGWHAEVRALGAEVRDDRVDAAVRAASESDEGGYLSVFGPGGVVSPREVAYRGMSDPGKILAELQSIYDAFGYDPRTEDPIDHVAVEAGFVGFMKLKQAFALGHGDTEAARTTGAAVETFLREHLAGLAGKLAERLDELAPAHLGRVASILKDRCPRDALRVVPALAGDPWRDADDLTVCGGRLPD